MARELIFDCSTGQGMDRDFEGELPRREDVPQDVQDFRRAYAIGMLRRVASQPDTAQRTLVHDVTRNLLIALGLEGDA